MSKLHYLELEVEDILLSIIDDNRLFNLIDDNGNEKIVDWREFWYDDVLNSGKYYGNY